MIVKVFEIDVILFVTNNQKFSFAVKETITRYTKEPDVFRNSTLLLWS